MAIVGFDPEKAIDFIPAYGNNRADDNPCVVRLKFIPYVGVQKYARLFAARTQRTQDPGRIMEISQEIQRRQFIDNVESISGFFIGEKEVTDATEFYEEATQALVLEIVEAMESCVKLREGVREGG